MAFKMKFSKDSLKGQEPVPPGTYTVIFAGFKPKKAKEGDSVNLNLIGKVVDRPDLGDNRTIWANLNTQIPSFIQDAIHSFGIEMENQTGEDPEIPGSFDAKAGFDENDPSTWEYNGPLKSKTAQWEVGIRDWKGDDKQEIIRFICAVPQCAERFARLVKHSTDMRKKS